MKTVTKSVRVAVLISDKINFRKKIVTRDEEGHFIMIIGSISQRRRCNHNKYIHNRKHTPLPHIHEAKTDRIAARNRQFNNNSWGH